MPAENENNETDTSVKTGLYEHVVGKITEWVKPHLHRRTESFVAKSIEKHAKGNPHFARMIAFEVKRRGDGAGLTQDVAEPIVWTGIKTAIAIPIAALAHYVDKGKFKVVGYGAALGILLGNAVELLRVIPRYTAGLQGSLEMAKDRWHAIEETGVDPFNNQQRPREINVDNKDPEFKFTQIAQKQPPVAPASLMDQANKTPQEKTL